MPPREVQRRNIKKFFSTELSEILSVWDQNRSSAPYIVAREGRTLMGNARSKWCPWQQRRPPNICVTSKRNRRAISNMHNYHYCTPERRGYWSRLSDIHEKPIVVRLESALTSDLKTAENYGSDYGVENAATFRSNTTTPFLKRRLREIVTDVRTLYE